LATQDIASEYSLNAMLFQLLGLANPR
jgi:hypothetical protein